jgi:hypothetical protein
VVVLRVFVVAVAVEVGLYVGLQDGLQRRELRNFLGAEVGRLVKHKSVTIAKNVG